MKKQTITLEVVKEKPVIKTAVITLLKKDVKDIEVLVKETVIK